MNVNEAFGELMYSMCDLFEGTKKDLNTGRPVYLKDLVGLVDWMVPENEQEEALQQYTVKKLNEFVRSNENIKVVYHASADEWALLGANRGTRTALLDKIVGTTLYEMFIKEDDEDECDGCCDCDDCDKCNECNDEDDEDDFCDDCTGVCGDCFGCCDEYPDDEDEWDDEPDCENCTVFDCPDHPMNKDEDEDKCPPVNPYKFESKVAIKNTKSNKKVEVDKTATVKSYKKSGKWIGYDTMPTNIAEYFKNLRERGYDTIYKARDMVAKEWSPNGIWIAVSMNNTIKEECDWPYEMGMLIVSYYAMEYINDVVDNDKVDVEIRQRGILISGR